jgi:hypothetical protein
LKKLTKLLFVFFIISLLTGFVIREENDFILGEKIIGFSVLLGSFIFLPLFLFYRYKNKKLSDYTFKNKNNH